MRSSGERPPLGAGAVATSTSRQPLLGEAFADVLLGARAGAGWAFERLFTAYAAPVAGYLRGQGVDDPDGLANEVFLAAFRALSGFEGGEERFRSWLFTIARHRMVDDRRRASRRPVEVREHPREATGGDVEDEALARLGEQGVRALLERLAPDQRDVLLLRVVGDLTIDQIAEAVGKRPGAVKALQRRGLEALRRIFEAEGVPL